MTIQLRLDVDEGQAVPHPARVRAVPPLNPNLSHWRRVSTPIVLRALAATRGQDERAIKRALRDAYPFGERENHPYKIWCSEVRRIRGMPDYVLDQLVDRQARDDAREAAGGAAPYCCEACRAARVAACVEAFGGER